LDLREEQRNPVFIHLIDQLLMLWVKLVLLVQLVTVINRLDPALAKPIALICSPHEQIYNVEDFAVGNNSDHR